MGEQIGLLERENELAAIERFLSDTAAGRGAPLMIEGEAGAGKTALLDEAIRLGARRGIRVLRAKGGEFERDFPYGVVRQLFEPTLGAGGAASLSGTAAMAAPAFEGSGAIDSYSILHGLSWLAADLAEQGALLLAVDDAQWADLASLQALAYIGRRLGEMGAGLAVTVRTGGDDSCTRLLAEVRGEPGAVVINPSPLSVDAVTLLATEEAGRTPNEAFAEACRGATGGNPFLVAELFRVLGEEQVVFDEASEDRVAQLAAAGTSRAILGRLARLGPVEADVAAAVAILEPRAEARLVAEMSGHPVDGVVEAGDRLAAAALFSGSGSFSFAHPLVREAVLEEIGEAGRRAAHGRAARLLDDDGAELDTVAAHLLLAEPLGDEWVVEKLREAAASAMGRGAPKAAVEYQSRTLAEPPTPAVRIEVRRDLGLAMLRDYDTGGIEILAELLRELERPEERAEIAAILSNSLAFRGRHAEAEAMLDRELAAHPDLGEELGRSIHLHLLLATFTGLEGLAGRYIIGPDDELSAETIEGRSILSQTALLFALGMGPMEAVSRLVARIGSDPEQERADARAGFPGNSHALALAAADRGDEALERFAMVLEGAEQRGTVLGIIAVHGARAYCRLIDGQLSEGQADAEIAVRTSAELGYATPTMNWLGALGSAMTARGEAAAALELLEPRFAASEPPPGIPGAMALIGRGLALQALGRNEEACDDFRASGRRLAWIKWANPESSPWRPGLVKSLLAIGRAGEAREVAAENAEVTERAGGGRGIGVARRVSGTTEEGDAAIDLLRESVEILTPTRARLQLAESLVELGAALRRANHRKEAREPLSEGLEIAHACGARSLEARARTELAAAGARPRNVVRSGVDSLTPSEMRVATLASEGLTNRQIAQSLTVTPKTVETHLRHVFQKLDLTKRTELSSALGRARPGANQSACERRG
jgi:DNA-binding CsgD family transcriptional regulator